MFSEKSPLWPTLLRLAKGATNTAVAGHHEEKGMDLLEAFVHPPSEGATMLRLPNRSNRIEETAHPLHSHLFPSHLLHREPFAMPSIRTNPASTEVLLRCSSFKLFVAYQACVFKVNKELFYGLLYGAPRSGRGMKEANGKLRLQMSRLVGWNAP